MTNNAPVMPEELTPEFITALLSGTRKRGLHDVTVRNFKESGTMTVIVNHLPDYKNKTATQLETSIKQGILTAARKNEDTKHYSVVWNDDTKSLYLIDPAIVAKNLNPDSE